MMREDPRNDLSKGAYDEHGALLQVGRRARVILTAVPMAQAEIRIGIAGPRTGAPMVIGEQQQVGASAAVRDLNEKGGVLGQEVVTVSADDACDAEQATAAARQIVSAQVAFVVGHVCSAASIAAAPIYDEAGIIMISPASTNPEVTDAGHPNVFRVIGRDDVQGAVAAGFISERFKDKRVAIAHDGQAYGRGLAEFTREGLNQRGIDEVLFEQFVPDQPDYGPLVDQLVAARAEVLYSAGYQGDVGIIVRQAKKALPDLQVIGSDTLANSEFRYIAGDAAEGTYVTFGLDPRQKPEAASAAQSIREKDAYEPDGYTLYAYAAVQTWAQAVERAGTTERTAVIDALRAQTFDTVLGRIGFDAKGDVTGESAFVWYKWIGDDYVPAE